MTIVYKINFNISYVIKSSSGTLPFSLYLIIPRTCFDKIEDKLNSILGFFYLFNPFIYF